MRPGVELSHRVKLIKKVMKWKRDIVTVELLLVGSMATIAKACPKRLSE
jgi:hypothetical protein|tara:strand:+ start:16 stop:162 length:147 start_codon:yes stop_codon:yes gene_type:complete